MQRENGDFLVMLRNYKDRGSSVRALLLPGGGLDAGETPEQANTREVREELGVELQVVQFLREVRIVKNYANERPNDPTAAEDECFVYHFYKAGFTGDLTLKEPEKFEELTWVNAENILMLQHARNTLLGDGILEALPALTAS